jgi:hypothetical protein
VALVVFTSGIVDDVARSWAACPSVLLSGLLCCFGGGAGLLVWNLGWVVKRVGPDTLLSFEKSGRPRASVLRDGEGWLLVVSLVPPLGACPRDAGGFWLVGVFFVNWIVDASIFTTS